MAFFPPAWSPFGPVTILPVDPRFLNIAFIISFDWQKHLTEVFPTTWLAISDWELWTDPHGWGFELRHERSGHRLKWVGKYFDIRRIRPCSACTDASQYCSGHAPCRRCRTRDIPCIPVKRSLRQDDFQNLFGVRNAPNVVRDDDLLPLGTRVRPAGGLAATIREHTMKTGDDMKGFVLWSIPCRRDYPEIRTGKLGFDHFLDSPVADAGNDESDDNNDNNDNDDNDDNDENEDAGK
jgi:hypothetical protein